MFRNLVLVLSAGFLAASLSACAASGPVTGSIDPFAVSGAPGAQSSAAPLPQTIATPAPAGYIGFCQRNPDQCQTPPGAPSQLALTPTSWQTISKINLSVNEAIWQEDDQRHYGVREYWNIATDGYGDCEDIALTKRQQLMALGLPEPALRIAVVLTPKMESHAVLTVATDHGDYVLDSLRDNILTWNQTGYTWIERQDASQASGWVSLLPRQLAMADQSAATASTSMLASAK
jgi:predicted transglutaminase-like cysteine proteinase